MKMEGVSLKAGANYLASIGAWKFNFPQEIMTDRPTDRRPPEQPDQVDDVHKMEEGFWNINSSFGGGGK